VKDIDMEGLFCTEPSHISQNKTETAAICAIVINKEAYLDEWVDYHLALEK
jgi:hypothetical protein